jgi:glycosyltransferase involved in cell wall biosynthesis
VINKILVYSDVEWNGFNRREFFLNLAKIFDGEIVVVDRPFNIIPDIFRPRRWRLFLDAIFRKKRMDGVFLTIIRPVCFVHEHIAASFLSCLLVPINQYFLRLYLISCDFKQDDIGVVWCYEQPQWWVYDFFRKRGNPICLWEVFDDYRLDSNGNPRKLWVSQEDKILKYVDKGFFLTNSLSEKYRGLIEDRYVIGNGFDENLFGEVVCDLNNKQDLKKGFDSVAMYLGVIRSWIDFELVEKIATENKKIRFVFYGPVSKEVEKIFFDLVNRYNNIEYFGKADRKCVPGIMALADVGFIPYLVNDFTSSVRPIKVTEFLSVGVPVVTTVGDDYENIPGVISICSSDDFTGELNKTILFHDKEKCQSIAAPFAWSKIAVNVSTELDLYVKA